MAEKNSHRQVPMPYELQIIHYICNLFALSKTGGWKVDSVLSETGAAPIAQIPEICGGKNYNYKYK